MPGFSALAPSAKETSTSPAVALDVEVRLEAPRLDDAVGLLDDLDLRAAEGDLAPGLSQGTVDVVNEVGLGTPIEGVDVLGGSGVQVEHPLDEDAALEQEHRRLVSQLALQRGRHDSGGENPTHPLASRAHPLLSVAKPTRRGCGRCAASGPCLAGRRMDQWTW